MRPKGSSARLEQRRRDAVAMLRRGVKAAAVARAVGVSLVSVGRWRKAALDEGVKALRARPVHGRPPKLGPAQRGRVAELLLKGPAFHGFRTELWTLRRVAEVIDDHFGVSYHPRNVERHAFAVGDWVENKTGSTILGGTASAAAATGESLFNGTFGVVGQGIGEGAAAIYLWAMGN